jgi:hypothetical protein
MCFLVAKNLLVRGLALFFTAFVSFKILGQTIFAFTDINAFRSRSALLLPNNTFFEMPKCQIKLCLVLILFSDKLKALGLGKLVHLQLILLLKILDTVL